MPADASIYGLIQQPKLTSPMEAYGGALQIKHLINQDALAAMQQEQLRTGMDEDRKLRDLFARGNVKPEEVMAISPAKGLTFQKNASDAKKTEAETKAKEMESFAKAVSVLKDRLPTVRDDASYAAYVEQAKALLGPDKVAQLGLPPAFDPQWVQRQLVEAKELFTPKPTEMNLGGKRIVVDMNPWTNPKIVGMEFQNTQTPDSVASNATTQRGQNMTQATAIRGQNITDARERDVDLQGRITAAREGAKNAVDARAALPQIQANAERGIRLIDELVGSADGKTKAHPGFQSAVGVSVSKAMSPFWAMPGTDRRDFEARLAEIKGGAFMEAFQSLRGGGQITEKEGDKATAAITRMETAQSEAEFVKAAREFQGVIKTGLERAKQKAAVARPAGAPPRDNLGGVLTRNSDGSYNYGF